jgi:UDP-glucose 4-epimerase
VAASEVAKIIMELLPGASIKVSNELTPLDEMEASFRGVLSIANAQDQLGWSPKYTSLRDGISEYISRYRQYLAQRDS